MKKRTPSSGNSDTRRIFIDAVAFIATIALLFLLRVEVTPVVGPVTMVTAKETYKNQTLPLFKDSEGDGVNIFFSLHAAPLRPHEYSIKVDDCIQHLRINGLAIVPESEPAICSPHDFTRVSLGRYLKTGDNTVEMEISDVGVTVGIDMHPSSTDPLMLAILLAFALVGGWFLWSVASLPRVKKSPLRTLLIFFFLGTFLRLAYVLATPYGERSHDTSAHLDYIRFVLHSWTIPQAAHGWEYHQAPLYYFFAALVAKLGGFVGLSFDAVLPVLQGWSLLFSVLSLGVLLFSIHLLFPAAKHMERWIAGVIVTVLPGVVYFASRITNEALSSFLAFLALLLLLQWWKSTSNRSWYLAWAVVAVMCITKINALLFVPILILCFFLKKGAPLKKRLAPLLLTFVLFFAAVAWYPIHRFSEKDAKNTTTLGNQNMDHNLMVRRGVREFVTFNPIAMATLPFNDSWKEDNRRSNFFEYLFRSAFFGEFEFKHMQLLASGILMFAYILVLPMLVGVLKNLRRPFAWLPLHLTAGAVAVVALLYPIFFPYAPNQDFRQSILLLLPIAYYTADGIGLFPRVVRHVFVGALLAMAIGIAIFLTLLYIRS